MALNSISYFKLAATMMGLLVSTSVANTARAISHELAQRYADAVVDPVLAIARSTKEPIRIYYSAACNANCNSFYEAPVPFPKVSVQRPAHGHDAFAMLREMFRTDSQVSVAKGRDGIIRISIGQVPTTLLDTMVSMPKLSDQERYNPLQMFTTVRDTAEMTRAMRVLRFTMVDNAAGDRAVPQPGLPHLPSAAAHVTVNRLLDTIAVTWKGQGLVIYGVCNTPNEGDRPFLLDYIGGISRK